ncbi:ATP-dependent Zn protease [Leptolyngbya sp. FACHB-671]|uniref:ATP-dependent Zn protease n=1 Tax=Leptolyngbya sp. FACHB-671 TaxID=2692812 RepID=UPI001687CA8E|nr:ATP-dependent Zn protease [Leptolyngbya sp. FACHB-671]MBD1870734.1 ATP-dependent Zn protease [Cyanobacteria bacterium FACHB-471]MBD2071741.1 ATP-dependent Zn protease [Leptolyngbya sp. FACHB-671]
MSQTALNLIAITIFTLVMSSLLGPLVNLSPVVPAIAVFGLLGAATLDTLSWQGRGGTLLLDWLARFSPQHRERVIHHEAGHFLVAHLLGIPITGYTLSAWEAFRQGQPGLGGVSFDSQELNAELEKGILSAQLVDRYCTVWMAGAAAEKLVYGNAEGGADDRQKLRILWTQLKRPLSECETKERWASLQARSLLEVHRSAYEELVIAMTQAEPVSKCYEVLEQVAIK